MERWHSWKDRHYDYQSGIVLNLPRLRSIEGGIRSSLHYVASFCYIFLCVLFILSLSFSLFPGPLSCHSSLLSLCQLLIRLTSLWNLLLSNWYGLGNEYSCMSQSYGLFSEKWNETDLHLVSVLLVTKCLTPGQFT